MKKLSFGLGLLLLVFAPACATSFQGSANVSPGECATRCRSIGGHMDAYVYMGDYSTACVCRPDSASAGGGGTAGGVTGAVAGVWMQMQRNRQHQNP